MGILTDLAYYAPYLTPSRGVGLLLTKIAKRGAKQKLRTAFQSQEPPDRLCRRLGLDPDPAVRLAYLRDTLNSLGDPPSSPKQDSGGPGQTPGLDPSWIASARGVLGGTQVLFGQEIQVGWPPKWGWRWDNTPLAQTFAADVRSTWELQRLQGLLPLAKAAKQTTGRETEEFSSAYIAGVMDFHREHPGPDGVAWESALELGLRLISLGQGLPLVVNSDAFAQHHLSLLGILDRHARWLAADLSLDKVVRGNHLLGELAGLLVVGHLIPSARGAWWGSRKVAGILEAEILQQIHPDGVSVEQSLTYEKFVLELLFEAGRMAARQDTPFSSAVQERLYRCAVHLDTVTAPDGSLPRVGDCDSGRGAGGGDDPHQTRELTSKIKDSFAGKTINSADAPLLSANKNIFTSYFPCGGHAVVKSTEEDFLFLRGGPFGHGSAGHSHADWLSPVLFLKGEAVLVDSGVFGYGTGQAMRNADREWPAHNVLFLDSNPGPTPAGQFRWKRVGDAAGLEIRPGDPEVEILGTVAWGRGDQALLWHRSIRYNQLSDIWLIRDRTSKTIQGPLSWAFHFAPGVLLKETGQGQFLMTTSSGKTYVVSCGPEGTTTLQKGWVAAAYGKQCKGQVLQRRVDSPPEKSELRISPASSSQG